VGTGGSADAGDDRSHADGAASVSYTWDVANDVLGWHYTPWGSTPPSGNPPGDPNNLANLSTPLTTNADDANNQVSSGSLQASVPFLANGDRIDIQAFSTGSVGKDWTGYIISAQVKLVSGGNVDASCPLSAWLYVSQAPDYATALGPTTNLVTGSFVTLTFDMATAGVNIANINQMGIQITTGTCANNGATTAVIRIDNVTVTPL
jgi:hypothetical protein